ncbi:unnamed protein product [Moneuplotes crassus]|uniref:Uncharacterized protein n=1 Tax=Euplotes crassus TaxID=5936 RepID=A0AAD1X5L6_EUPCR|nr:unnamed protein product [Moneuplotes crassus]
MDALRLVTNSRQGRRKGSAISKGKIKTKKPKLNTRPKPQNSSKTPSESSQTPKRDNPKRHPRAPKSDVENSATFSISSDYLRKPRHQRKVSNFGTKKPEASLQKSKRRQRNHRRDMNRSIDLPQTPFDIFKSLLTQSQMGHHHNHREARVGSNDAHAISTISRMQRSINHEKEQEENQRIIDSLKKENDELNRKIQILEHKLTKSNEISSNLQFQIQKVEEKQSKIEELRERMQEFKKKYKKMKHKKESLYLNKINEYKTREQILIPKFKQLYAKCEELAKWKKIHSCKWDNLERDSIENKLRWVFNNNQQELETYLKSQIHTTQESDANNLVTPVNEIKDINLSLAQRPFKISEF